MDIYGQFMRSFVDAGLIGCSVLVWGWPLVARFFPAKWDVGVLALMLPRRHALFLIILDVIALMFHVVGGHGGINFSMIFCFAGNISTIWMRSALRRQVSP